MIGRRIRLGAIASACLTLAAAAATTVGTAPAAAATGIRTGMTWTVLGEQDGSVHVGADGQTNAYAGDTTVDQYRSILCLLVDGRSAPAGITFDFSNGWARGAVRATPAIAASVLTSQAQADEICADTFGAGWRLAEFHDGRYGPNLDQPGGWSFWAAGSLAPGTRLWTAISDQPANAWNSAGTMPAVPALPKFIAADAEENPIAGQYQVMFPDTTAETDVAARADALVAAYGGKVLDVQTSVLGFSFAGTEAQAQAMSAHSWVETVEQDTTVDGNVVPWHLDRVDQRALPLDTQYAPTGTGAGVNIYVLDSGFRYTHTEIAGRARSGVDLVGGNGVDCMGHGTATSGMAAGRTVGVAPAATLISVRIFGCSGGTSRSKIVSAFDWVARNHVNPAVANGSFGGKVGFLRRWFNWRTPEDKAVRRATQAGVTVVVSAGNNNDKAKNYTPARAAEAITVGATNSGDQRAYFSNYGKVDLFAPGQAVLSGNQLGDTSYSSWDGTSFSSPMVAGAAALYLQSHPTASPGQVKSFLQNNATPNVVGNPGSGSTNRLLYTRAAATHAGMTWTVLEQRAGAVRVGADGTTNPYSGDTPASAALPVLCLLVDNTPVPAGITPSFYAGWARGPVRLSPAVSGGDLTSRATADAVCAANFGAGWRMAEFHDGRYGANLEFGGGWAFWGAGTLPAGTRFWTAINDQPANNWN